MITYQLTGKTRYRIETRWFRKPLIVVQVEVHKKGSEVMDANGGRTLDFDEHIWCDARLEDLQFVRGE